MARFTVTMPQLGESVSEGTISRWLVKPGDHINEFDPLLEVLTDKVDAEVPAPATGVVTELLAEDGAIVPIGAGIAVMEVETAAASPAATPAAPAPAPVTPAARPVPEPGAAPAPAPAPQPRAASVRAGEQDAVVPLSPTRRIIAAAMSEAKSTIPHAWQTQEVDMNGVVASVAANRGAVRRKLDAPLTFLAYVVAAAASALREHPAVNATFGGDRIIQHATINIGVAVAAPEGVIVPVIRHADTLSIGDIAAAVDDLATRARDRTLTPDDVAGATFTVNNSGTLGTLFGYSIITPGQAGILTMEAVVDRPVVIDKQIVVRPMMYLCFSLDHRMMDGLTAAAFLSSCRLWLEGVDSTTVVT